MQTATGRLAFAVADLTLHGGTPLAFQRTYASDRTEDVGLGRGWSFVFNDYITVHGETATLVTASDPAVSFRREGDCFRPHTDAPGKHQRLELKGADLILEQQAGSLTRFYRRSGEAFLLSRIALRDGGAINITRDSRGRVTGLANGTGSLVLHWAGRENPRLLRVTDQTGRHVVFHQSARRLAPHRGH